jgi:hypothetical protein
VNVVVSVSTTSRSCNDDVISTGTKVNWLKDGKEVPRHFRFIKSTTNFQQTLTIKNAELGDAGQYQCIADATSSTAILRVKG